MDSRQQVKLAKSAYEPYKKEARYCLIIDLIVSILLISIFVAMALLTESNIPVILVGLIILIFLIVEIFTSYRLSIILSCELKKKDWTKEVLTITDIELDFSWSGHHGKSVISKLYPKEKFIERYRLICKDENLKTKLLRCTLNKKQHRAVVDYIFSSNQPKLMIYYGSHSRVIFYCVKMKTG